MKVEPENLYEEDNTESQAQRLTSWTVEVQYQLNASPHQVR